MAGSTDNPTPNEQAGISEAQRIVEETLTRMKGQTLPTILTATSSLTTIVLLMCSDKMTEAAGRPITATQLFEQFSAMVLKSFKEDTEVLKSFAEGKSNVR